MFAEGLGDLDNYGSTHPAVEAHAVIGRTMLHNLPTRAAAPARSITAERFAPVNGGRPGVPPLTPVPPAGMGGTAPRFAVT